MAPVRVVGVVYLMVEMVPEALLGERVNSPLLSTCKNLNSPVEDRTEKTSAVGLEVEVCSI